MTIRTIETDCFFMIVMKVTMFRSLNYFKIDNYYEIICDFLIEKEF